MNEGAQPDSRFVQVDGLRLHHLDWGNPGAEPLVMLHGVRLHAHCWSDFARRMQARFRVLALDARGHGDSAWSPRGDYHLHTLYEDLRAVLDAEDVTRCTLVGHSMGARTALLFTYLHPEAVRRLVLVDMGPSLPESLERLDFSRVTETPSPREFVTPDEAADYLAAILSQAPREMIEESVKYGMRRAESGRHTWKYDPALSGPPRPVPGMREWDLWEAARQVRCPVLLLRGEHSMVVTPEIAGRMEREMADCRVETVAGAGHALFTEQPRAFADSVSRFLEQTDA